MLDQDTLKQYVHYNPVTGVFTRLKNDCPGNPRWAHLIGKPITAVGKDGYLKIEIQGKEHRLHRLAWLYMTGSWPKRGVDHKNRVRSDNRWTNLREADQLQQIGNMSRRKTRSKSGVRGVHFSSTGKPWIAHLRVEGRNTHLGAFDTIEEAKACYEKAARAKFGEFYSPWVD